MYIYSEGKRALSAFFAAVRGGERGISLPAACRLDFGGWEIMNFYRAVAALCWPNLAGG